MNMYSFMKNGRFSAEGVSADFVSQNVLRFKLQKALVAVFMPSPLTNPAVEINAVYQACVVISLTDEAKNDVKCADDIDPFIKRNYHTIDNLVKLAIEGKLR